MKKSERKEKSKQEFLKKNGFGGTPTPDVGAIPHPPKGVPIPDPNAPKKPYK